MKNNNISEREKLNWKGKKERKLRKKEIRWNQLNIVNTSEEWD